jgi:hypothetical protein
MPIDDNPYKSPHGEGADPQRARARDPLSPPDQVAWFLAICGAVILAYIAYRIVVRNFGPYGYFDLIRELFWGMSVSSAGLGVEVFGSRKLEHFAPNMVVLWVCSAGFAYLLFR